MQYNSWSPTRNKVNSKYKKYNLPDYVYETTNYTN